MTSRTLLYAGHSQSMPKYTTSGILGCHVSFTGMRFVSEMTLATELEYCTTATTASAREAPTADVRRRRREAARRPSYLERAEGLCLAVASAQDEVTRPRRALDARDRLLHTHGDRLHAAPSEQNRHAPRASSLTSYVLSNCHEHAAQPSHAHSVHGQAHKQHDNHNATKK
jgi:hypothetical protein